MLPCVRTLPPVACVVARGRKGKGVGGGGGGRLHGLHAATGWGPPGGRGRAAWVLGERAHTLHWQQSTTARGQFHTHARQRRAWLRPRAVCGWSVCVWRSDLFSCVYSGVLDFWQSVIYAAEGELKVVNWQGGTRHWSCRFNWCWNVTLRRAARLKNTHLQWDKCKAYYLWVQVLWLTDVKLVFLISVFFSFCFVFCLTI